MPTGPVGRRLEPGTLGCSSERGACDRRGPGPYVRRARRRIANLCDRLEEALQHRVEQLGRGRKVMVRIRDIEVTTPWDAVLTVLTVHEPSLRGHNQARTACFRWISMD
jgi:hypothetical protein